MPPSGKRKCGELDGTLTVQEYSKRLKMQGKYQDQKPGTSSQDGCLHNPPRLPPVVTVLKKNVGLPKRGADGCFIFKDHPAFKPNLSPKEVLQLGSFGGTYFRDIISAVSGKTYKGNIVIKEFPKDWFKGLKLNESVCSATYDKSVNRYKVSCGGSLGQWECSGWISAQDPYGWFQWYCRFFLGRRTTDDERQISRWQKGQGPTGRWRVRLCNDILRSKSKLDDNKISPVLRQVLQHWAYRLTDADLKLHKRK
eukprot:CAMPEP_0169089368 /NCGR_PEP_ID=MMETSP1015-20121227/15245_1 /TAXON_ID=342587 /ORGANISM="Karlodinium micrum, Strain CCMP2283" /LENGTH=252 /DNA_ID=CAMNT_0009149695 /DNA_START=83 /DNA_END=841 /DNA_ORIENTATION=+